MSMQRFHQKVSQLWSFFSASLFQIKEILEKSNISFFFFLSMRDSDCYLQN